MNFVEWVTLHPLLSAVLLTVILGWIGIFVIGFEAASRVWHTTTVAIERK